MQEGNHKQFVQMQRVKLPNETLCPRRFQVHRANVLQQKCTTKGVQATQWTTLQEPLVAFHRHDGRLELLATAGH